MSDRWTHLWEEQRMAAWLVVWVALAQQQGADLIVLNARIYTSDVNRPVAEALAVKSGRIAFLGSSRAALALAGAGTERLDCSRRTRCVRSSGLAPRRRGGSRRRCKCAR